MDRLGLICQSLRDYIYFKENNFENRAYFPFIVPINSLKDSLGDQFLANTSKRKCRLSTIIDIYNNEDLEFCVYLSIDECYFTIPEDISITNLFEFASKIMDHISTYPHIKFIAFIDDYFIWYKLKKLCNFHSNLLVCPTLSLDYTKCVIWKTSSLRSFILTPGHFLADYSLTSNHAQFIRELCMRNSCVYLKCNNDEIKYMIDTLLNIIHASPVSQFLTEFNLPMDTIGVNLPSYAYEIFEADRMKYKLFFLAISKSILAINKPKDKIILAVLGAGRGPLVDCAIKAGIKHIYGIEKNHIAMNFLKQKKEKEWKEYDIILFEKDIREIENITDIKGHDLEKADIIVSELLGSLGDNELAPEILRQYEHIGKTNCAMIPNNFSSILVPIMSEFLWSKAFNESKLNKILIIHLNASIFLSEPKQCFEFVYPGENILYKTITMDFLVKTNATCHGFGGWFVSTLFDDITMTTSPIDGTNDLFSWAPVFLPIDQPFLVQTGDRITLTIKRKGNNKIVWYEWAVFNPVITAIQNAGGSSYSMKLY